MSGDVLVRIPVAELDDTLLGLRAIVTATFGAPRTVAGGISDLRRYAPRKAVDAAHRTGPEPVTAIFIGGERLWLTDDDVVLVAASPTALEAVEHP